MKKLTKKRLLLMLYIVLLFVFVVMKLYKGVGGVIGDRNHIIKDRLDGYLNINLIPLKTIKSTFNLKTGLNIPNIVGNTVPYIVLGIFVINSQKKIDIIKSFLICILIILSFELIQFITCMGFLDIDDIVLNTSSSLFGIIFYYLYKVWTCSYHRITNKQIKN